MANSAPALSAAQEEFGHTGVTGRHHGGAVDALGLAAKFPPDVGTALGIEVKNRGPTASPLGGDGKVEGGSRFARSALLRTYSDRLQVYKYAADVVDMFDS